MTTGRINQVSKIQSRQLALVSLKIVRIKIHKCVRMNLRPSAKKSSFVALPLQSDYGMRPRLYRYALSSDPATDASTPIANAMRNVEFLQKYKYKLKNSL